MLQALLGARLLLPHAMCSALTRRSLAARGQQQHQQHQRRLHSAAATAGGAEGAAPAAAAAAPAVTRVPTSASATSATPPPMRTYFADWAEVILPDGHRFPMEKYKATRLKLEADRSLAGKMELLPSPVRERL